MRKPGSKTGMSPASIDRPFIVLTETKFNPACVNTYRAAYGICHGMQGHVQNDSEIFLRDLSQQEAQYL